VSEAAREIASCQRSPERGRHEFGEPADHCGRRHPEESRSRPQLTHLQLRYIKATRVALVSGRCPTDEYVKVDVTSAYNSVTPLLGLIGTFTMQGSSSAQIQQ
jgi:hypothetical protein